MLLATLFAIATADLRLELVRESLTGTHCRYRLYREGLPSEEYVTRPCVAQEATALLSAGDPGQPSLRNVNGRVVRRTVVVENGNEPWIHDSDAETGVLVRRLPAFFRAKPARVFDPNPVVTLNAPQLQDSNDSAAAVPGAAYFDVVLPDVEASGPLRGPYVTLVDRQLPAIAPPLAEEPLLFNREQNGFEDVNAYFHIDRNQRYVQSLGYTGARRIAPYPVEVDAHGANGADDSFFLPSTTEAGRGRLIFGEGGTDDAEDADLLVHEYTHALHEWIAPGTFGGGFASESRALAEGIADYWAYSAHVAARRASGRDPYCFADWDARCASDDPSQRCSYPPGADCLRRLDSTATMADFETGERSGVEHRNGTIWSSALRELHDSIGKTTTDTLVLESLFAVPPGPTFAVMAQRMIEVGELLYGGTYSGAICFVMFARGILTECDRAPRGEWTHVQSSERNVSIPENDFTGVTSSLRITDERIIDAIRVRIDIEHPSRGDLLVTLIAPDGTSFILHQLSGSQTAGLRTTYGLTAMPVESLDGLRGRSAAGLWKLVVADRRPRDQGTLISWGLEFRFLGDVPQASRPTHTIRQTIPVVAHLYGVENTLYVSDVRIANVRAEPQQATLVFTRSAEDGRQQFAAVKLTLAGFQTVAFDDVVDSVFHTGGSGALEVLGDVLVMSRTYLRQHSGTLGQQVPPNLDSTAVGEPSLLVAPMAEPAAGPSARYNLGLAETAGGSGVVRVGEREIELLPFSHVQFPVVPGVTEIRVLTGDARVVAYLSQVQKGDAMFLAAESVASARARFVPAITGQTSDPPRWRSDLWLDAAVPAQARIEANGDGVAGVAIPATYLDVLAALFHRTQTLTVLRATMAAGTYGATRIVSGDTMQAVPLLTAGPAEQHLLFAEVTKNFNTNAGIASSEAATAELVVFDSAGIEQGRMRLSTTNGLAQVPIPGPLSAGRVTVRFLSGQGRAYLSMIDRRTGDATFVPGQGKAGGADEPVRQSRTSL